jgi:hypothetical protein
MMITILRRTIRDSLQCSRRLLSINRVARTGLAYEAIETMGRQSQRCTLRGPASASITNDSAKLS